MKSVKLNPGTWLAIAVLLIMAGTISAHFFNTSAYKVQVTEISFQTDKGMLNGLLYLPAGAGPADPRPTIITTHGYLNAKEMQDAPAIEMSRRGFVVLALDMYAHGDSYLNSVPLSNPFFAFWPSSIYDAVQYMYNQPYVLKDDNGNGIIGVSGHSMGGFSSTMAVVMDEQAYQKALAEGNAAVRKISAVLTAGSDFRWTSYLGVDAKAYNASLANRTAGAISGQFDEFFFDSSAYGTGRTIVRKNYAKTADGMEFLGNPSDAKDGVFYSTAGGGRRIIYQPKETHPWNHFSIKTTAYQIEFYNVSFQRYLPQTSIKETSQIWRFKEYSEFIALIGFFLLFIPMIQLLMTTPFFSTVKSAPIVEFDGPVKKSGKAVFWAIIAFSALFPAVYFQTLMAKLPGGLGQIKLVSSLIFIAAVVVALFFRFRKKDEKKFGGWILTSFAAFLVFGLTVGAGNLFQLSPFFNEPQTNAVVFWAMLVAVVTFLILCLTYLTINKPAGMDLRQYGLIISPVNILKSFLLAVIAASAGYVFLFIIDLLFKTDFRIWLVAVRAFNSDHFMSALRYMPFFFLYYFSNGVALQVNTNSKYLQGVKGYLVSYLINIGGLILFLIAQYGKLFITGTASFPTVSLNSIVLIGFVVMLFIATVITKKALEKTNNVYTGAFLNTIVFTLMAVSSSTMYINLT
ncbi:alpha/beta hydrolase [Spirochaeta isovalerica]|uniref:Pimeloyl-ACP methyl ester carboxylesterase n=1 Tax=Spirochaeta isovalerica TaxID=150 RepID=A0A841RFA3_9SPIO|nr:hypothetical protein [Spirochaeta isovalerica]MBB6481499.1 pimeloyl-ACP methyl ester carboxylesterase [Spirochaeta isovalerica]